MDMQKGICQTQKSRFIRRGALFVKIDQRREIPVFFE
jgi:hypothetical protein